MTYEDATTSGKARKLTIPSFVLTEICNETDEGATRISIQNATGQLLAYERPKLTKNGHNIADTEKWKYSRFNAFPVVLCASSLPWNEATLYIIHKLEDTIEPVMSTFISIADDLSAYRRFLDDEMISWNVFPVQKLARPTYRYSSYLRSVVYSGKISVSSARRHMGTVIAFYRWLKNESIFVPANMPWKEKDVYIKTAGAENGQITRRITTTDVTISVPKQTDPYDRCINDGGKLRPLSPIEQHQLMQALHANANTEMTLIHLFSLLTGARIQSVLTFRVRHVRNMAIELEEGASQIEVRCPIGPGTGIDTKLNKLMSLHIPAWFVRSLHTYIDSERSIARRKLAVGGDVDSQYLFLSKFGAPFYQSRSEARNFDPKSERRHPIKGQSVRKFISERIIPYMRRKNNPQFRYQFHDLRASFGMNLTDSQLKLVEEKRRSLHEVREFVKVRMGHASASTTDGYLQYRGNISHIQHVADDHEEFLRNLGSEAGLL